MVTVFPAKNQITEHQMTATPIKEVKFISKSNPRELSLRIYNDESRQEWRLSFLDITSTWLFFRYHIFASTWYHYYDMLSRSDCYLQNPHSFLIAIKISLILDKCILPIGDEKSIL